MTTTPVPARKANDVENPNQVSPLVNYNLFTTDATLVAAVDRGHAAWAKEKIIELGRLLDVDLIVRGRIIEFGYNPVRPTSSVVQLRIYAQDAKSGDLFWSNRGEFEVARSADHRMLFNRAAGDLIDALMRDFFGER